MRDAAQIGEGVADFGALIEARAADDAIGQAERNETFLEFAHLERGAHENGDLFEIVRAPLQLLDRLADRPRFLLAVPDAGHAGLFALAAVGEQRLAESALIVGDQMRGGGENMAGGAIIALEPHGFRAGKILFETQDVFDLGAAPAIDALVVVPHAADVAPPLRDQPQPQILRGVGVLIFVDQNIFEAPLIIGEHVRVVAKQPQRLEQQIAEIDGVEDLQALLIQRVKRRALAVGEVVRLARRDLRGRQAAVLPAVDPMRQRARRPPLVVDVLGLQNLFEQADLIVRVENGEIGFEPDQFGVAAQDFRADRVKSAEPLHRLGALADQRLDALAHLARRLVGEGDRENFPCPREAEAQYMGDAGREHARLAGAGAGQHQHGSLERLDGGALLGIEHVEITRPPRQRAGLRGETAGGRVVIVFGRAQWQRAGSR